MHNLSLQTYIKYFLKTSQILFVRYADCKIEK